MSNTCFSMTKMILRKIQLTQSSKQRHQRRNRGDRIRTCDLVVPNDALYQAELHPEVQKRELAKAGSQEWAREDSNLRRRTPTGLQPVPFGHLGTRPDESGRGYSKAPIEARSSAITEVIYPGSRSHRGATSPHLIGMCSDSVDTSIERSKYGAPSGSPPVSATVPSGIRYCRSLIRSGSHSPPAIGRNACMSLRASTTPSASSSQRSIRSGAKPRAGSR